MKHSIWLGSAFLPLALVAVCAVGCNDVKTPDGRVPSQYLGSARTTLAGTYSGTMSDVAMEMTVHFKGSRPLIEMSQDLVDPRCGSKIGQLLKFKPVTHNGTETVVSAEFAFDPGSCTLIEGRVIDLRVRRLTGGPTEIKVSLLDHSVPSYSYCQSFPGYNGYPNFPYGSCAPTWNYVYRDGTFSGK